VTPTPADVEHRWRLWRRDGPGDLQHRPARPAEVVEIATDDATERVPVFQTPAWPTVFYEDDPGE
jgi:hypothetical protein